MAQVILSPVPAGSALQDRLKTAYFHDSYQLQLPDDGSSPMALYLRCVGRTPGWIDFLMRLRNRVVAPFGIKDLGTLSGVDAQRQPSSYRVGDRVGIFRIRHLSDTEVVMGQDDKHLDVQVSICKQPAAPGTAPRVVLSTVVHIHNTLGHAYMAVITPIHRVIARGTAQRLADHGPN